jgi:hypothetical protein
MVLESLRGRGRRRPAWQTANDAEGDPYYFCGKVTVWEKPTQPPPT